MLGDNQPQICLKLPHSDEIRLNWRPRLSESCFELIRLQYASFSFFIISSLSGRSVKVVLGLVQRMVIGPGGHYFVYTPK